MRLAIILIAVGIVVVFATDPICGDPYRLKKLACYLGACTLMALIAKFL